MTSVFISAGEDGSSVSWQPEDSGRGRERITLRLCELVRATSSLPRLVQIVSSGDERACGDFGPLCVPPVDLNRPVVLYHDYRAVRVRARSVRPGAKGDLESQGPPIVIPDSYRGWFAVVTPGGRSAPCYDTMSEVVSARLTVFLTRHDIPAYIQLKNGVPVKRETSRQDVLATGRNPRRNVVESLSAAYCRCSVPSGSVLRVLSVFRDINTTIPITAQDPSTTSDYVQCVNYKNEVLFIPVEVRGRFFAAASGAGVRPDWRHVCQLSQLLRHRVLPVTVRLVCGYAPRHAEHFTGLLRLETACHQHLVLGCSTISPSSASSETSAAEPALFELDVGPSSAVSAQLQLLPLDHRCPLMATPFARAADVCRRHGAAWKRQMRVAYGLYAEGSLQSAESHGSSSVRDRLAWRAPADKTRLCPSESGPSSVLLPVAPVEPEVDYDQGELGHGAAALKTSRNRVGWQIVHIGEEKKKSLLPGISKPVSSNRDLSDRVSRVEALGKIPKSSSAGPMALQQRLDRITRVDLNHSDSREDSIRGGPLSLQTSVVSKSDNGASAESSVTVSPVYVLSNRPVRSLSAHNIPLRRRLAKTVSLEAESGGSGQGWRQAVSAFLSGRQVRGRRSRGNADVTSSFIFKRPDNMNASDHWRRQQGDNGEKKEESTEGVGKDRDSVATTPGTTNIKSNLSENIYAEIEEDSRVHQIVSSVKKINITRGKLPADGENTVLEGQPRKLSAPFQRRYLTRRSSYGGSVRADLARGEGGKGGSCGTAGVLEDTLKLGSDGHSSCTSSPADTLEQWGC